MLALTLLLGVAVQADGFSSAWDRTPDRVWIGREYWANPLNDWRIQDGRMECVSGGPNRNVHLLTRPLGAKKGTLSMSVVLGPVGARRGTAGFRIGVKGPLDDWRSAIIRGKGLDAGITAAGALFIGAPGKGKKVDGLDGPVELRLDVTEDGTVTLSAATPGGNALGSVTRKGVADADLAGHLLLVSNPGKGGAPMWFRDWKVSGTRVETRDDRAFGPIFFAMHSLSRGVMKMTAQMPPVGAKDPQTVRLVYEKNKEWVPVDAKIDPLSRTATFRVEHWEADRDVPYQLLYQDRFWKGTVRKDPVDRRTLVVAGFTGNTDTGFPNHVLAGNVAKVDPDVMVFTGDQYYENVGGYGIIRTPTDVAALTYLHKWYLFGWAFGDLMRDRVTLCLPDDHDVYQGNIWGQGGRHVKSMREHATGGYAMDAAWVNAVQRSQTSHHPDPFDPTPVDQGITVYYGDMLYGGVSFAVIEDRKFKSGPEGKVNTWKGRPDHVRDDSIDPKTLDKPGLVLLGERQLKFLRAWAADWRGAKMKIVCSQTIFANVANYHGGSQMYLAADLDSNGWPQTGRDKALREMRRGFAFHLAGDQHLASIVHHGVEDWRDACISFCVPSIAAGYPRSWHPERKGQIGKNRAPDWPDYAGDFLEGLGNKITVRAAGNPEKEQRKGVLEKLHDKASGFGVVRLDKETREITMECWRLLVDVANPKPGDQFPGWPQTITQEDNYARKPVAWLPELKVTGMADPVVQVIEEKTREVVYTIRIRGTSWRPRVFAEGTYTIKVGEPGTDRMKTLTAIKALPPDRRESLDVTIP